MEDEIANVKTIGDQILMVITSIIGLMLAKHGVGTAIVEGQEIIVEAEVMHALLFWTSNLLLFGINAIAFSKVSWFITLIRLVTKRWQKVVLWVLMVFSTAALFVASTFGYYQCHFLPDGSWNTPATSDHRCLDNWMAINTSLVTSIYSTVLVRSHTILDHPCCKRLFVLTEGSIGICVGGCSRLCRLELATQTEHHDGHHLCHERELCVSRVNPLDGTTEC